MLTSRYYESEADLRQMQDLLMAARAATDDWQYAHVGELMWNFFMVACHLEPRECIRLWHNPEGRLIGFAILGEDPSVDWQLRPEYEWRGIEAEVLAWTAMRLAELRGADPQRWCSPLVAGARQDNTARIAFLAQHGFRYSGEFAEVNMLRSLDDPIPAPVLPPGCEVRAVLAEPGDITTRAAAQRAVWQPWSVGNVSAADYAALMESPGYQRELDVVTVTPDGTIAAYVNGWLDPVNRIGDLGPVGALPALRRQGLTRAALLECLRRLQAVGMNRVCVSTGETNTPARRLYESVGFSVMNRYLDYVKPTGE
jgi:ribosomal protein S18 acetylase RimI-like enzyme